VIIYSPINECPRFNHLNDIACYRIPARWFMYPLISTSLAMSSALWAGARSLGFLMGYNQTDRSCNRLDGTYMQNASLSQSAIDFRLSLHYGTWHFFCFTQYHVCILYVNLTVSSDTIVCKDALHWPATLCTKSVACNILVPLVFNCKNSMTRLWDQFCLMDVSLKYSAYCCHGQLIPILIN